MPEGGVWEHDWDLLWANANRVEELLGLYEQESLDSDERHTLMQLLISSYDDRLNERGLEPELEHRLVKLLKQEVQLHIDTLEYWGLLQEPNPQGGWAVTPLIRKVWAEYEEKRNQAISERSLTSRSS
jgi:hypothetical protein